MSMSRPKWRVFSPRHQQPSLFQAELFHIKLNTIQSGRVAFSTFWWHAT